MFRINIIALASIAQQCCFLHCTCCFSSTVLWSEYWATHRQMTFCTGVCLTGFPTNLLTSRTWQTCSPFNPFSSHKAPAGSRDSPCHLEITQVTNSISGSVVPAMVEVDAHITQRGCQPHSLWIGIKRADLGLISWKELGTGVKIFYSNSLPVERENPSPDPHA